MATVVCREATAYEEQDLRARRPNLATVDCRNITLAPRIAPDLHCLAPSLDSSTVYVSSSYNLHSSLLDPHQNSTLA